MDVMSIRRRLLMQMMGGKPELWNRATITVPSNMATSGDIYAWLTTNGVLPNYNTIFFAIRDNADTETWEDNDFVEASWFAMQTGSNIVMARVRAPKYSSRYLQTRNPINTPTDTMYVYQGETFTVFYQ